MVIVVKLYYISYGIGLHRADVTTKNAEVLTITQLLCLHASIFRAFFCLLINYHVTEAHKIYALSKTTKRTR